MVGEGRLVCPAWRDEQLLGELHVLLGNHANQTKLPKEVWKRIGRRRQIGKVGTLSMSTGELGVE